MQILPCDAIWLAAIGALPVHEREGRGLIHSDVHIGNWYQTATGGMDLCDWRCLSRGHWSRDVVHAIAAALTPDDRRKWETDLLARYLDRFAELTNSRLDFDESFRHYRERMVHALLMWTITLCHSPLLPNMQPEETTLMMIQRITTAIADLETL